MANRIGFARADNGICAQETGRKPKLLILRLQLRQKQLAVTLTASKSTPEGKVAHMDLAACQYVYLRFWYMPYYEHLSGV